MTTTTTTYRYRAQTDATIRTWHLGAAERDNVCFCGVKLMTPDDERKFALKVPAEARTYETSDDLTRVTCGACKRSREYAKATAADLAAPSRTVAEAEAERPSRRRKATGDPRADRTAADAAAQADAAAVTPERRRRPSRADRAHARQEQDRARREAEAAGSAG
ncbi:MAG TPA: hypothetical protein VGJ50_22380 [Streptosporangiaceae bacterium]